jgi:hypothetical protein
MILYLFTCLNYLLIVQFHLRHNEQDFYEDHESVYNVSLLSIQIKDHDEQLLYILLNNYIKIYLYKKKKLNLQIRIKKFCNRIICSFASHFDNFNWLIGYKGFSTMRINLIQWTFFYLTYQINITKKEIKEIRIP